MARIDDFIFFTGGINNNTGCSAIAGGVTREWWDANVSGELDRSLIMGVDGSPLCEGTGGVDNDPANPGKVRISTSPYTFDGVADGMLAYVNFVDVYTDGIYKIIDHVSNISITLELTYISACSSPTAYVGGAFDGLQNPITYAPEPVDIDGDVHIFDKIGFEALSGLNMYINAGSLNYNNHVHLRGFTSIIYDDFSTDHSNGRSRYGGALGSLTGAFALQSFTPIQSLNATAAVNQFQADNIHFYGYEFTGVVETEPILDRGASTSYDWTFTNCKFTGIGRLLDETCYNFCFYDCYFDNYRAGSVYISYATSGNITLDSCVIAMAAGKTFAYHYRVFAKNNIFIGGARAILVRAYCEINNNIFYKQTTTAIQTNLLTTWVREFNNIFILAAVDDYAVKVMTNLGSVNSDYSLAYCADGTITTDPWYDYTNARSIRGEHSLIDIDPLFQDEANYLTALDAFELELTSPARGTGRERLDGKSDMGAFELWCDPVTYSEVAVADPTGNAAEWLVEFGESVVYKPAGGSNRAIKMYVIRGEIYKPASGPPYGLTASLKGWCANSDTEGISSEELNKGGDLIALSVEIGEAAQDRRVIDIKPHDADMCCIWIE